MKYVIGIDLGTQSMKGLLVNSEGKIIAEAVSAHDPSYPNPGWAEQYVPDWIESLKKVIHKLLSDSGIDPADVGTIGLDSQVDGAVPIDKEGNVLMNAPIWLDRRAEAQCRSIEEKISSDRVFSLTGLNLDSSHVAPKLLWIKEIHPEVFEKSVNILLPGSYIVHWLTGESYVDYSNASSSMLYNVSNKCWDDEMAEAVGIDPKIMGTIGAADDIAGTLTSKAAAELGLTKKTKVIIGCGDEHAACVGAGAMKPGMVCDITGTAEPVAGVSDKPVFDNLGHLVETHSHADRRWWLIENPGFVSGGSTRWFCDTIIHGCYDDMNVMASGAPIGSDGVIFLPCMSGAMTPRWNGNARGTFVGLSLSHTLSHLSRSVFEGIAFGLRDNIDRFEEIGLDCSQILVIGGGTKSPLWCQIKADCLGRTLTCVKNSEGAAIGAAMLAGVAEGFFENLDEAAEKMVELGNTYVPDLKKKSAYDDAYGAYRDAYDALEPFFDKTYKGK
ncbi:xylulokinase [Caproiciproducens sp.]